MNDESVLRFGTHENFVEVGAVVERDLTLQSHGDVRLLVLVRSNGFSGHNDLWVQRDALIAFAAQLAGLDSLLSGKAKLSSISPGELELVIRSVSTRGHIGVAGSTGYRIQSENATYQHSVSFWFEIEPSQLSAALQRSWLSQYLLSR